MVLVQIPFSGPLNGSNTVCRYTTITLPFPGQKCKLKLLGFYVRSFVNQQILRPSLIRFVDGINSQTTFQPSGASQSLQPYPKKWNTSYNVTNGLSLWSYRQQSTDLILGNNGLTTWAKDNICSSKDSDISVEFTHSGIVTAYITILHDGIQFAGSEGWFSWALINFDITPV